MPICDSEYLNINFICSFIACLAPTIVYVDGNSTIIDSPYYGTGLPYDVVLSCGWQISAPAGKMIKIRLEGGIFDVRYKIGPAIPTAITT